MRVCYQCMCIRSRRKGLDRGELTRMLASSGDTILNCSELGMVSPELPGEPHQHRVLRVAVVDDQTDQPEGIGVFDLAGDQSLEDLVVDGWEELADIRLENVTVTAGKLLAPVYGGVGAFPLAAGVAVEDERPLEDRLQHAGQSMMHHPVPERGGADLAGLAFVNRERPVGTGTVGLAGKFLV